MDLPNRVDLPGLKDLVLRRPVSQEPSLLQRINMLKRGVWRLKGPTTTRAISSKDQHAITTIQKSTGKDPPIPTMYIRTKTQQLNIIILVLEIKWTYWQTN